MSLALRFLGTSAARPTVERNVTSVAVVREGESFLFDCGEGTQRQMMRYGVGFSADDIFFTHFHTDHLLGLVGLTRTLALQGRTDPLRLWGPPGATRVLRSAVGFGGDRLTFPVEIGERAPGEAVERRDYRIEAVAVDHRGAAAVGWALIEKPRLGRFDPDRARALGIPEGPLWGRIHKGEAVTLPDGRVIEPSVLVGAPRRGRRLVISGDTRPTAAMVAAAEGADLLVHEATFGDDEAARAVETGHSTAVEAAEVAHRAGVHRLLLTHFSARYSRDPSELVTQARRVFAATDAARDGLEIELPYEHPAPAPV
ncbi:MAG: ribonuclease Z [Gemmatimonadaceae bacterium]|jgi:ribonuclease Z|nr:ribonuclease Z [Gemmatimonadaceae bacterium]